MDVKVPLQHQTTTTRVTLCVMSKPALVLRKKTQTPPDVFVFCYLFLFSSVASHCQNSLMGIFLRQEVKQHMTTPAVCFDKLPHCQDGVCVWGERGPSVPSSFRRSHSTDHTADHLLGRKIYKKRKKTPHPSPNLVTSRAKAQSQQTATAQLPSDVSPLPLLPVHLLQRLLNID